MTHVYHDKLNNAQMQDDYLHLLSQQQHWIDVRAPIEFDKGQCVGAHNLPILNDDERQQVGTCYKHNGQDAAVALGEKLVSGETQKQRVNAWKVYIEKHPDAVLYCFRGGMRSKISQYWLAQQGIDINIIKGGFKALRQACIELFSDYAQPQRWMILGGYTGSGKTDWLVQQRNNIDLEGLANHKGSAFGGQIDDQPTQINFEFALSRAILNTDSKHPILVEDEGRFIGGVHFPIPLADTFAQAPVIVLQRSLAERTEITIKEYIKKPIDHLMAGHASHSPAMPLELATKTNQAQLQQSLNKISKRLGGLRHKQLNQALENAAQQLIKTGQYDSYQSFISPLLEHYYDPMYEHNLSNKAQHIIMQGDLDEIEDFWHQQFK